MHIKTKGNSLMGLSSNIKGRIGHAENGFCNLINDDISVRKAGPGFASADEKLIFHLENTPLGFIEWNDKLQIKSLSKRAEEIFGWSLEEFMEHGKTGLSQVYKDDQPMVFRIAEQLISGTVEKNNVQHRNYTKDGKVIWCDWFNSVLKDNDGKVISIMSLVQDITERKENEAKQKESELRLKEAQKMVHVGSWELDFSTGIAEWSEELLRIYGLSTEDSRQTYESWMSFIHPQDLDRVISIMQEAKKTFSNHAFFHRIIRRDGSVRQIYSHAEVQFNNQGKPAGLYGVGHDVTEMKDTEDSLRESQSNMQAIFENTSEGFILTDTKGIVKAFNNNSRETILLNVQKEIKKGESIFNYIHESRKDVYEGAIAKVLSGETLRYDYSYERKNGEIKWFDFIINPVYDAGKIAGLSITSSDITTRKEGEQSLLVSESNLKAIIKNTDASIYSLDSDLRYITFNQRLHATLKELYGLDIKPGDNVYDFLEKLDPKEARSWQEVYSKALNGEIVRFEKEFKFKDYHNYSDFSIHPIWEEEKVIGLSCLVQDITERKKGEEVLRKTESNMQAILENTYDGIILLNTKGNVQFFNSKAKDLIFRNSGARIEIDKNILDFTEESRRENVKDIIARVLSGEIIQRDRSYEKNGETRWFIFTKTPVYNGDRIVGICITSRDITERKRAEEENRFKANLLNTVAQAVINTDLDGVVNYWNKAAEKIYGWTEEESLGKNIIDLITSHHTKEQGIELMEKLQQGNLWSGEIRVTRKNGTDFPVFVTNSPVYDQYDTFTGIIGVSTDITEKKKLEELLDKANRLARIGTWEVDLLKKTVYWSAITKEIHEVNMDFIPELGTAINFYKAGSSRESISHAIQQAIYNQIPFDMELQIVSARGSEKWVRAIGEAECIDDKCIRIYGSFQDIDAGKRAGLEKKILEQQLLEEQMDKQKDITKAVVNAQEKERAEIGVELHDNINQLLAASKLYLGHSLTQADHTPFVVQSQQYISSAMDEIRKLSHALVGPSHDKTLGLIDSLDELIGSISAVKNIRFNFIHSTYREEESETGLKLVIYRIIQEQLNNVIKHAQASEVEIELKSNAGYLEVIINDNGKGFNTFAKRKGIGLHNIKNRAEVYNGEVGILSSPGNGCKMKIVFKNKSFEEE